MQASPKFLSLFSIFLLACLGTSQETRAQTYPVKPIRLIVPYVAGGSSDQISRLLGSKLTETWKQQVIVDNRSGNSGIIGTDMGARSAPDGYTLITVNIALPVNQVLRKKIPYDIEDLSAIIVLARLPTALVAHSGFPSNTIGELISLSRKNPDIPYGSSGVGTVGHVAGELLKIEAGIKLNHVAYKGGGQLVTDVLGNQIGLGLMGLPPAMPHIKSGRLKALGLTDGKRATALPSLPTIGETINGFEVNNWIGIVAPANTPSTIVEKINAESNRILQTPEMRQALAKSGFEIWGGSSKEFKALLVADVKKYSRVVKEAGIPTLDY